MYTYVYIHMSILYVYMCTHKYIHIWYSRHKALKSLYNERHYTMKDITQWKTLHNERHYTMKVTSLPRLVFGRKTSALRSKTSAQKVFFDKQAVFWEWTEKRADFREHLPEMCPSGYTWPKSKCWLFCNSAPPPLKPNVAAKLVAIFSIPPSSVHWKKNTRVDIMNMNM